MDAYITWLPSPREPILDENDVHVWLANLDLPESTLFEMLPLLSGEEHRRRSKIVHKKDRDRFVASHGILRLILARYLSIPPCEICFETTAKGKPRIGNRHSLRFNLSHSAELALYALDNGDDVGIDLERLRNGFVYDEIVENFLSASEKEKLDAIGAGRRETAFYLTWTRKEAYAKAIGDGLSASMNSFDVFADPSGSGGRVWLKNEWSIYSFCPKEEFIGAIATKKTNLKLSFWEWNPL
jgi:4'-phosphopantetheinyl transferase